MQIQSIEEQIIFKYNALAPLMDERMPCIRISNAKRNPFQDSSFSIPNQGPTFAEAGAVFPLKIERARTLAAVTHEIPLKLTVPVLQ